MTQPGARATAILAGMVISLVALSCCGAESAQWSYAGPTGPAKWGGECKLGQNQSPIDIPDAAVRKGDLPSLLFNYKPVPLKVIDNGHTIQVNYSPGSFVTVEGKRWELVQFHFHKPSEEKIDGKAHDMVAHLVHQGPGGKLAVVAVFLDPGKDNALIKTLWDNLPKEKGKEIVVDGVKVNALELLPSNKGYYTFSGSLTTPPCSEDVTWFVLKTPLQVSPNELFRFGKVYPMNARPVQAVNGRDIQGTR